MLLPVANHKRHESLSGEVARSPMEPHRAHAQRWVLFGLIVYALLNVGDLLTTHIGLTLGLHEGNPLMSRLLHAFGFGALIYYKLLVIVLVTLGVTYLMRRHARIAAVTLALCSLLVGSAVVLNLVQFPHL